jgi:amidase
VVNKNEILITPELQSPNIESLVAQHKTSPATIEETVESAYARVDLLNPRINAIVQDFRESARERARYLSANAEKYADSALYGVPVTIKESFTYKSTPTTLNFPPLKNYQPEQSSILAQRLEDAGAIIIGKTNIPTMLSDCQSFGPLYPTACNPYDTDRTPGGSTGGGAASLAAEFAYAEIGSDIGGSIRNPANFCGLFGLKPSTNGHVHDGHIPPMPNKGNGFTALNSTGPLARTMGDLKAIYSVCYQPLVQYQQYMKVETNTAHHNDLSGYKIAYFDSIKDIHCSRATQEGLNRIVKKLEQEGASVTKIKVDEQLVERSLACWVKIFGFVCGQDFPWAIRKVMQFKFGQDLKRSSINAKKELAEGLSLDFAEYSKALLEQKECIAEFYQLFDDYDFILSPTSVGPAFQHNHKHKDIELEGQHYSYTDYCFAFVMLYNLLGLPVLCVPSGLDEKLNLPVGISVAAPHHSEEQLLHFGELLENAGFGFVPPQID